MTVLDPGAIMEWRPSVAEGDSLRFASPTIAHLERTICVTHRSYSRLAVYNVDRAGAVPSAKSSKRSVMRDRVLGFSWFCWLGRRLPTNSSSCKAPSRCAAHCDAPITQYDNRYR